MVRVDDPLDHRQAQAGAGRLGGEEGLENPFGGRGRDSIALITHLDAGPQLAVALFGQRANRDDSPEGHRLQRIHHQVHQGLPHQVPVNLKAGQLGGELNHHFRRRVGNRRHRRVDRAADDRLERNRLLLRLVRPSEIEQVRNDSIQAVGFLSDDVEQQRGVAGRVHPALEAGERIENHPERISHLVRHHCRQLTQRGQPLVLHQLGLGVGQLVVADLQVLVEPHPLEDDRDVDRAALDQLRLFLGEFHVDRTADGQRPHQSFAHQQRRRHQLSDAQPGRVLRGKARKIVLVDPGRFPTERGAADDAGLVDGHELRSGRPGREHSGAHFPAGEPELGSFDEVNHAHVDRKRVEHLGQKPIDDLLHLANHRPRTGHLVEQLELSNPFAAFGVEARALEQRRDLNPEDLCGAHLGSSEGSIRFAAEGQKARGVSFDLQRHPRQLGEARPHSRRVARYRLEAAHVAHPFVRQQLRFLVAPPQSRQRPGVPPRISDENVLAGLFLEAVQDGCVAAGSSGDGREQQFAAGFRGGGGGNRVYGFELFVPQLQPFDRLGDFERGIQLGRKKRQRRHVARLEGVGGQNQRAPLPPAHRQRGNHHPGEPCFDGDVDGAQVGAVLRQPLAQVGNVHRASQREDGVGFRGNEQGRGPEQTSAEVGGRRAIEVPQKVPVRPELDRHHLQAQRQHPFACDLQHIVDRAGPGHPNRNLDQRLEQSFSLRRRAVHGRSVYFNEAD